MTIDNLRHGLVTDAQSMDDRPYTRLAAANPTVGRKAHRQTSVDGVIINWADYVSNCKLCGWAVLRSHSWVWSTSPMGIVHTECHNEAEALKARENSK